MQLKEKEAILKCKMKFFVTYFQLSSVEIDYSKLCCIVTTVTKVLNLS